MKAVTVSVNLIFLTNIFNFFACQKHFNILNSIYRLLLLLLLLLLSSFTMLLLLMLLVIICSLCNTCLHVSGL